MVSDVSDVSPGALAAARVLALFTIGETPWSEQQKKAAHDSWRSGALRILGVHSATDANHGWPEYGSMLGARFDGHPWTQDFLIDVVDTQHPATAHLGTQWSWRDEVYLFADLRPDARVLLRLADVRSTCPCPGGGNRPAASPLPGAVEDGAASRFTAPWVTFPEPGRPPATSGTWPAASPGSSRTPNLTSMSGSSSVDALPEVMAAAVYQSPGVVTVEERTVPTGARSARGAGPPCGICGSDIHQLRDGWGFTPGAVAGHESSGTIAAVGEDVIRMVSR